MWLEADATIRRLSAGRRTIDDFARAFFGGTSTGPQVVTYTREDIIKALNAVQPYDWRGFLAARIDAIAPHPPDPFTPDGWRVAYEPKPNELEIVEARLNKSFDLRYSLGIVGGKESLVADTIDGSPAQRAGIAPGDKIVAVDGRAISETQSLRGVIDLALLRAEHGGPPIRLLILGGGVYRDIAIPYAGGPRYPVLEPIPGATNRLDDVSAPLGR